MTHHPDSETIAAFAEGRLRGGEAATLVAHLDQCESCTADVSLVMGDPSVEKGVVRRGPWRAWMLAVAAAFVLAIAGVGVFRPAAPMRQLVELAPTSERTVEPRLTGGFAWAEYAGTRRASGGPSDAASLKLAGAAGELVERADRDSDAGAQHAAGVAMVLVQKPEEGIARLEKAAAASSDAKPWSDLAAARYAAASQLGRASLYPLALSAADEALRREPSLAEARFNRALILERMGLADEAKRAWERYLEVDASSPWAREARARLAELQRAPRASFDRDRPLLEEAAARGDAQAVRQYVDLHRSRARAFAEAEYLGRWAAAVQQGDEREAARWLTTARNIADALASLSGESLARDAVRAVDSANRAQLASAHVAYRDARLAYSRDRVAEAERELLRAAELFEATRSPMALMARYYAASARLARNDVAGARVDLERALLAADAHPTYVSLGAHVRWELGRALMLDSDWTGAVPVLTEGAERFRRCGERASEAFVETMLGQALSSAGRADDAWLARMRSFAALSAEDESALLATSIAAAVQAELLAGGRDSALALSAPALAAARAGSRPEIVIDALLNQSLLQAGARQTAEALQTARDAGAAANAMTDPALRERHLARVSVAVGAALAVDDPRAAMAPLTRAIDYYAAHDLPYALPDPLLLRARGAARTGDVAAALRDLERGMSLVAEHRDRMTGVLDAEHALFTDAIALALDRGDEANAFAYAERSRGASLSVAELQQRLAGSNTAIVEIVALPNELVTFAVAANDFAVARRPRDRGTLAALAEATLTERDPAAAATLYDEVIRPVDALLARAGHVAIVADARLETAPFAALYDRERKRHLVERFTVSMATSAASLQPESPRAGAPSLAAFALPSGGDASSALPESESEVAQVAALYGRATAIHAAQATLAALRDARADVLHVSGHTERQPGGGEHALLLTGARGVERASWKSIVAAPGDRGVVILAACETLRPPASAATRALSLGGAFSAAGATDVIGTLAPVGDRDARLLFRAIHRRLAAGATPAEALRAAQCEAIANEREHGGRRAWRAVALLTRRIAVAPRGKDVST